MKSYEGFLRTWRISLSENEEMNQKAEVIKEEINCNLNKLNYDNEMEFIQV